MTSFAIFSGVELDKTLIDNETGYVGRNATIDGSVISSGASTVDLRVDGTIAGDGATVSLTGSNVSLFVGRTGLIQSYSYFTVYYAAVDFTASSATGAGIARMFNAGEVSGNVMAVYAAAEDAVDVVRISNNGNMIGETDGIFVTGFGKVVIANSGSIEGFRHGISNDFFGLTNTQLVLTNSGVIRGGDAGIQVGAAADKVVNLGRLEGEVRLGGGNDLYDGRSGIALDAILLQAGDDRFVGNANWAELVDGGDGVDVLDFRQLGGVVVALDGSFGNAGAASGDSYAGFEAIWGSAGGDDQLRGDSGANSLFGYGGADVLEGGAGRDILRGGAGQDTLTGGIGNDTFEFVAISQFGDTITDFSLAGGNNDTFLFSASELGGGLAAGVLAATQFQTRADNLAQDADDRFIFRTTDKSLWFDVDGNGGQAAVMVADLQAAAVVTNLDIVLV